MKSLILTSFIIMFFFKTGNVLSEKSIFDVNNIEIETKNYIKNNEEYLNQAFIRGFDELTKRILLKKDYLKLKKTPLSEIKELISHYQVINSQQSESEKKVFVNLFFDRKKINNFFFIKNLTYSDLSNAEVVILPIKIKNDKIYVFNDNYFFENWNSNTDETFKKDEIIEYLLPIENLDIIRKINLLKDNLESLEISEILSEYNNNNIVFLVINLEENFSKIFLKIQTSNKKIIKNFKVDKSDSQNDLEFVIKFAKNEIEDVIKSQNIIDVRTPTFLNIKLNIKKKDDLFKLQNIFEKIDIVDTFFVREFNNEYAKVKIKFYGKLDNFYKKLEQMGANIKIDNDSWSISIS